MEAVSTPETRASSRYPRMGLWHNSPHMFFDQCEHRDLLGAIQADA